MVLQVQVRLVEAVGNGRAARAGFVPVGVEHEVIDDQLRTPSEQIHEQGFAILGVEAVGLVEADPRQIPPPAGQLVVQAGQLLFSPKQLKPGVEPLGTGSDAMIRHRWSSSLVVGQLLGEHELCHQAQGGVAGPSPVVINRLRLPLM